MRLKLLSTLLIFGLPALSSAMGLGGLELQSTLNQPFLAKIELVSATPEELETLKVTLADQAAFKRVGIERTFVLTDLKFSVEKSEQGTNHIIIRSNKPIREPFLNFLIEVTWPRGRLFREYTALMDPPKYTAPEFKTEPDDTPTVTKPSSIATKPSAPPSTKPKIAPATPQQAIGRLQQDSYGPVVQGDTLWSIAKMTRPDTSVSIQQMMLAILNANPKDFINNNINGLKRGAVLHIPDVPTIRSLTQADAVQQTNIQHSLWAEYRGKVATPIPKRPISTPEPPPAPTPKLEPPKVAPVTTVEEKQDSAELRLVTQPSETEGSDQAIPDPAADETTTLANDLAIADESIEVLTGENAELIDRLTETEGIIQDLQRLIVLKENTIAAMQEQIIIANAEAEKAEETVEEKSVDEPQAAESDQEETPVIEAVEGTQGDAPNKAAVGEGNEGESIIEPTEATAEQGSESTPANEATNEKMPGASVLENAIASVLGIVEKATAVVSPIFTGLLDKVKTNMFIIISLIGVPILIAALLKLYYGWRSKQADLEDFQEDDVSNFDEDFIDSEIAESETSPPPPDSESQTVLADDEDITPVPEAQADISEPSGAKEDLAAEVNVFLAYEHYDEAESFIRKALAQEPDSLELQSKLLEVFYASGNKKAYEETAQIIHDKTGGQGEYWKSATAMWQEMSPNRALFEAPTGDEDDSMATSAGGGIMDIATADQDTDTSMEPLDITAAVDMEDAGIDLPSKEAEEAGLDFTLEAGAGSSAEESDELLDQTLEFEPTATPQPAPEENNELIEEIPSVDAENDELLDQTLEFEPTATPQPAPEENNELIEEIPSVDAENDELLDQTLEFEPTATPQPAPEENNELIEEIPSVDAENDANLISVPELEIPDEEASTLSLAADAEELSDSAILNEDTALDELEMPMEESSQDPNLLDVHDVPDFEDAGNTDLLNVTTISDEENITDTVMELHGEKSDDMLDMTPQPLDEDIDNIETQDLVLDEAESDSATLSPSDSPLSLEDGLLEDIDEVTSESMGIGDDKTTEQADEDDSEEPEDESDRTLVLPKEDKPTEQADEDDSEEPEDESDRTLVLPKEDKPTEQTIEENDSKEWADDEGDRTFLMPKPAKLEEQSQDDLTTSQIELAKAYIELGEKEDAKVILDEIIATANANHQRQAKELLGQIS